MNTQLKKELTEKMEEFALNYLIGNQFQRKETNLQVIDYLKLKHLSVAEYAHFSCMYADKRRDLTGV